MFKWLILLSILCAAAAVAESVWTWTDEDGVVHYSDRPVPGAREVQLRDAQTVTVPRAAPARQAVPGTPAAQPPYNDLRVLSPDPEETFWNIAGTLTVQIATDPELAADHRVDVLLNGERRNLAATSTRITLTEIWRGEHTLQALITDSQGRELQRSEPVVFYVQQTSVQNPNNPNVGRR